MENIAFRDRKLHKYYFILSLVLLCLEIFFIVMVTRGYFDDLTTFKIVLIGIGAVILLLFYLVMLLSPKVAISKTQDGLIIRQIHRKIFVPFNKFMYVSSQTNISKYHRDDNAFVFLHNKNNTVGTLFFTYSNKGIATTVRLLHILDVEAVELTLNSLKTRNK